MVLSCVWSNGTRGGNLNRFGGAAMEIEADLFQVNRIECFACLPLASINSMAPHV
ncbi:hypothetical protein; putative exported protein [Thiomonas arsenitoxydans]|uniref:Uncharacterized protein n=1 Tax=Thiomonas arsenitoxydans (strain DSM 22701 / CIP 110005 / 3As) TaxID=426114 RepID=D6CQA9_THIA3|nr:hypothetical protein; putative exported protein [Thiomonas arsenitoxydans]